MGINIFSFRLFDSQNNNRGGVNVGETTLKYYTGQYLEIEYTQQHSCNAGNAFCDTIIQVFENKILIEHFLEEKYI